MHKIKLILLLLLIIPQTLALNLLPEENYIEFVSNAYEKVNFKIINNENKEMQVALHVEGELKDYVKLHDGIIDLKASNKEYETFYEVKLPDKIEKPGNHEIRIKAIALYQDKSTSDVITKLHLLVPYPTKHLEVSNISFKENKINIKVINLGEIDIVHAKATIDIFDYNNNKVKTFYTEDKSIKSLKFEELNVYLEGLEKGKYYSIININYDSNNIKEEFNFELLETLKQLNKNNNYTLLYVLIIIILVNIGWFIYIKKRK